MRKGKSVKCPILKEIWAKSCKKIFYVHMSSSDSSAHGMHSFAPGLTCTNYVGDFNHHNVYKCILYEISNERQ